MPHLITDVHTVPAIQQDHHALATIQANLAAIPSAPAQQVVDAGYISAKRILESRTLHGIDLVGPVHVDPSWQARTPAALDVAQFPIETGNSSRSLAPKGNAVSRGIGEKTPKASQSSRSSSPSTHARLVPCVGAAPMPVPPGGVCMTLRFPQARHEMLQAARLRQRTAAFRDRYRVRSGIEGTCSQATRNTGLRRARTLHWPAQDPSAASLHGGSHQCRATGTLARRTSVGYDACLSVRSPRCLVLSSPTVSHSRYGKYVRRRVVLRAEDHPNQRHRGARSLGQRRRRRQSRRVTVRLERLATL